MLDIRERYRCLIGATEWTERRWYCSNCTSSFWLSAGSDIDRRNSNCCDEWEATAKRMAITFPPDTCIYTALYILCKFLALCLLSGHSFFEKLYTAQHTTLRITMATIPGQSTHAVKVIMNSMGHTTVVMFTNHVLHFIVWHCTPNDSTRNFSVNKSSHHPLGLVL